MSDEARLLSASDAEIQALQLDRLRVTLERAKKAPYFADRLKGAKVGSLADLAKLPITTKADLQEASPFGSVAVPNEQLFNICRKLDDIGCGFYPNSKFVHIDIRRPGTGHAYWIDISGPGEPSHYVDGWPGVVEGGALSWDAASLAVAETIPCAAAAARATYSHSASVSRRYCCLVLALSRARNRRASSPPTDSTGQRSQPL